MKRLFLLALMMLLLTMSAHARFYASQLGRFASVDPAQDGLNLYAYCGNRPLNHTDPTGMFTEIISNAALKVSKAIEYDNKMKRIFTYQPNHRGGGLCNIYNCIFAVKLMLLKAEQLIENNVTLQSIQKKAGRTGHFKKWSCGRSYDGTQGRLSRFAVNPIPVLSKILKRKIKAKFIQFKSVDEAMKYIRENKFKVIMISVNRETVGGYISSQNPLNHGRHWVAMYYNPYSKKYMSLDPNQVGKFDPKKIRAIEYVREKVRGRYRWRGRVRYWNGDVASIQTVETGGSWRMRGRTPFTIKRE